MVLSRESQKYHIDICCDLLMCPQLKSYRPLRYPNILAEIMANGLEDTSDLVGDV